MKMLRHKRVYLLIVVVGLVGYACRYNPPVEAVDGHQLIHVTDPGPIRGLQKNFQMFFEMTPCTYELLGWDESNRFYYTSNCHGETQSYRVDGERVSEIVEAPAVAGLARIEMPAGEYRDYLFATRIRPATYEEQARKIYTQDEGFVSPDGENIAFVTRYIYSVYDVLILNLEGS